jgi:hypothetical protein
VIDQQPQIELWSVEMGGREGGQAFAQRGPGAGRRRCHRTCRAGGRSCASGPSGWSRCATPARRQRSRTARRSPTRAGRPQAPRRAHRQARAPTTAAHRTPRGRPGPSARPTSSPVVVPTPAIVGERLWVSAPSTIMAFVLLCDGRWTAGGPGLPRALPRSLSVQGTRVKRWAAAVGGGGACARSGIMVVCARAPSLISVRGLTGRWGRRHDG